MTKQEWTAAHRQERKHQREDNQRRRQHEVQFENGDLLVRALRGQIIAAHQPHA